jgi:hypothetical protein
MKTKKPVLYHPLAPERWPVFDPYVYTSKSVYMQRVLDKVSHAHPQNFPINLSDEKAWRLAQKWSRAYEVNLERNEQTRRRKAGKGTAALLLWKSAPGVIQGHLLVSARGEHPARQLEELRDATKPQGRITVTGYELVRLPRSEKKTATKYRKREAAKTQKRESSIVKHARKQQKGMTWTWRMTEKTYQSWRDRAIYTARNGNARDVEQFLYVLYGTPGFRGCRYQVGKIMVLFRGEWKRARSDHEELPPNRSLYYARRLADVGMNLRALIRETRKLERKGAKAVEAAVKAQAELDIDQLPPIDSSKLVRGLPRLTALVEKAAEEVPVMKTPQEEVAA